MSALDTSLAALIEAHNLSSASLSMLSACDQHDAFFSMSLQWREFGALDGVIEHGKTSSEALQNALAKMMEKRPSVILVGELA